jgi:glucose-1-phosphate cytidylyltransferase
VDQESSTVDLRLGRRVAGAGLQTQGIRIGAARRHAKGLKMKVVLFCGGLGTRIRDVSESIPKPMIPVGDQPILWHLMNYYSLQGHKDFILCLGYKANIIKQFFLSHHPQDFADHVASGLDGDVQVLGDSQQDWRVTLVDTGLWRNIGERLCSVRKYLAGEEIFLANYSDGLADANLNELIEIFNKSNKAVAFLAVRPSFSLHMVDFDHSGNVLGLRPTQKADMWVNGGFFIMRQKVFNYIEPGEELVEAPFQRLIEDNQLMAFKHESFWRPMDTLKDKQVLEDLFEQGIMPWRLDAAPASAGIAVPGGGL